MLRTKQAQFRDSQKTLDNFDLNKKMNRSVAFDLAQRLPEFGVVGWR